MEGKVDAPPPPEYHEAQGCAGQPMHQYPAPQMPYPQPQPQYQHYQQQQTVYAQQPGCTGYYAPNVVVTQQQPALLVMSSPTVVVGGMFGTNPVQTTCPYCRNSIVTSITFEFGLLCWLIVGILFVVGCWLCCFIPFCVPDCQDVVHTCPSCRTVIGRYKRM